MPKYVCRQCGTQYAERREPPAGCVICEDDRQYVRWAGQEWVILEDLAREFTPRIEDEAPQITGIGASTRLAIGQRALLLQSPAGNVLWDCIALLTPEIREQVERLGGLAAIAISHPHYYTAMVEWSDAFGGIPIFVHADDRRWVQRTSPSVNHWSGETLDLNSDMTLVRCGGHFDGSTVLHWKGAMGGNGAIFSGDGVQVTENRQHVSFMYSFPNLVPLGPNAIRGIERALEPLRYDAIFGAWWGQNILRGGKSAVRFSIERYLSAIAS